MAAITADNTQHFKSKALDFEGFKCDYEVAASTVIYRNSFVGLNATGYLTSYVAPSSGTTQTGTSFRGIALEHIASQTSDGDARCKVLTSGYFEYPLACDRVDIGVPVVATDNATLSMDLSAGQCIGYIVAVEATTKVVVKMDPFCNWSGKILHVSSFPVDVTQTSLVLLVHETDNPNGLVLLDAAAYVTEAIANATTAGVVTIGHTTGTNTTMGCTFTVVDNGPIGDLVLGVGGQMLSDDAAGPATSDNIVKAPAGEAVIAKTTTTGVETAGAAGMIQIFARFGGL